MIIVDGFQPLTIITKRSILDVAAVLDPPLAKVLLPLEKAIYPSVCVLKYICLGSRNSICYFFT